MEILSGNEGRSDPDTVELADSQPVSIKLLQSMYNELTGKSEKITKRFTKPIQVEFVDFTQLNAKIEQAKEQYNIISANCSTKIFYTDNTRTVFSSFDRFQLQNCALSCQVENILITYNFLIKLPNIPKAQNYTISLSIDSRLATEKRIKEDGLPSRFMRMVADRTGLVEVEYIDFMVAKTFINLVDDWYQHLPFATTPKLLNFIQK